MDKGFIRLSISLKVGLVLFVRTKDCSLHICIDKLKLNMVMVNNKSYSRGLHDLFHQFEGSSFFSKIDLQLGCHQLRVREADIVKMTFQNSVWSL